MNSYFVIYSMIFKKRMFFLVEIILNQFRYRLTVTTTVLHIVRAHF